MKSSFCSRISNYIFNKDNACNIASSFFCSVVTIISNLSIPYLFNEVISGLSSHQDLDVIDEYTISPIGLISLYAAVLSLPKLLNDVQKINITKMSVRSGKKLTMHYLSNLMRLPMNYHLSTKDGRKLELMNKAFAGMIDFTSLLLEQIIPTGIEGLLAIIILNKNKNNIAAIGLGGIFILNSTYSLVFSRSITKVQDEALKISLDSNDDIHDFIHNVDLIHTSGTIEHEIQKINETWIELEKSTIKFMTVPNKVGIGQQLITNSGLAAVFIFTGKQVLSQRLSVSHFIVTLYYLVQFSGSIIRFSDAVNRIRSSISSLKAIFEFFENHHHTNRIDLRPPLDVMQFPFDVVFDKVSFSYQKEGPSILKDFSLHIKAGKKYGIIGESGAGKSTLIRLMLGFIQPSRGTIKIANQDISQVNSESIRSLVGVVPQNPVLFNNTLRYNISYGTQSAREDEIFFAARKAGLSDNMLQEKFPLGLDTSVGKRGDLLSGGERQRVAIARALCRKPKMFIFDEATASLDQETEDEVQNNVDEISQGTTTLVVSHKLSAVKNADCILALDKGGIAEIGTHQELLKKEGIYYRLWAKQAVHYTDVKIQPPTKKTANYNNKSNLTLFENKPKDIGIKINDELKEPLLKENDKKSSRISCIIC